MIVERPIPKIKTDESWRREWVAAPKPVPRLRDDDNEEEAPPTLRKIRASQAAAVRPPMAQRGSRVVRRARALGWRSPETASVLVATFVVSLLCFYVAAYARVTAEGFELSRLKRQMRASVASEDALRAEISRLTLPGAVARRAATLKLIPGTPQALKVVSPPASAAPVAQPQNTGLIE